MGIAFVPLPSLTFAAHPVASRERHLRGCLWHDSQASEAGRRGVIKRMGQSGGHGRVKCEDRTVLRGRDQIKIDGDRVSNMEGGGQGGVCSVLCTMPRLQAPNRGQWNGP